MESRFTCEDDVKQIILAKKGIIIDDKLNVNGKNNLCYVTGKDGKYMLISVYIDDFSLMLTTYYDDGACVTKGCSDVAENILGPEFNNKSFDDYSKELRQNNVFFHGEEYRTALLSYLDRQYEGTMAEIDRRVGANFNLVMQYGDDFGYGGKVYNRLQKDCEECKENYKKEHSYWEKYKIKNACKDILEEKGEMNNGK